MVHGIVHRHQGHIRVSSRPEEGTTIRIHWPALNEPVIAKRSRKRVSVVPGNGERILVVDDEVSVGGFLGELLGRRGYVATVTADPEEAQAWARQEPCPYDLMVTDQTMPMLTGFELAASVRDVHPGLPIILCTGYTDLGPSALGENATLLRKPVTAAELVQAVQERLGTKPSRKRRRA